MKNEKNIQPKVVTNNQYFSPFQSKKSKSKISNLLLKVGQHFNINWNGNVRLSRISGVTLVPNLSK